MFNWEKIRKSGWLDVVVLMNLWSVYLDTGDPVPVEIGFVWDTDPYPEDTDDHFWREAWIYGEFGSSSEPPETVVQMKMFRNDDDTWDVHISYDGYTDARVFKIDTAYPSTIDKIFWDEVKKRMEEIGKDEETFLKFLRENLFYPNPPKLFKTKEEAISYGNGIKMTYAFLKEIECELPDGETAEDWLMRIYS